MKSDSDKELISRAFRRDIEQLAWVLLCAFAAGLVIALFMLPILFLGSLFLD